MEEELKEILDALQECYFEELTEDNFYDNVVWYFSRKYKKSFDYDSGASKLVLIFKELNFVIKIPFAGTFSEEEYDEEADDYFGGGDFIEYCGADCEDSWDYCSAEAQRYEMAKDCKIEDCFAKMEKIAEINGYPIYMQEYVNIFIYGDNSRHTEEDTKKMNSVCEKNDFRCFNKEWLSDVFSYFGEEIFYKFMDFIDYIGINDLHDGNIGYIKGRPVLMDYAGWDN